MHPGQEVLAANGAAPRREWLLTNGLGGYAAGSVDGTPTRRTHGLLVTAGLHGRQHTLLLHVETRATVEGAAHLLGHPPNAGGVVTAGRATLESFTRDPFPTWRFRAGATTIERTVFTLHRHHAVVIAHRHVAGPEARLGVSPLLVARDPNALQQERADIRGATHGVPGRVRIETLDGVPALTLWHNGAFLPARAWQCGIAYPADPEPCSEDAFIPGHVEGTLAPDRPLLLVASSEDDLFRVLATEERLGMPPTRTLADSVAALEAGERDRIARWRRAAVQGADFTARQAAAAHGGVHDALARRREPLVTADHPHVVPLALALRAGLVRRGLRTALVTGLPDAHESGAGTLRALPALVALRAFDVARDVLRGAIEYLNEGLAPGTFDRDDGSPVYDDPAAALWLVHAADLYARRSADGALLSETLFPALEGVMQYHRSGTRGIRVDADGLLETGEGEGALKRADLNALWYHALVAMAQLAKLIGRKEGGAFYLAWAREHQKRFNEAMWDEERGCLYEAIGAAGPVRGLSPGQLLAVGLPPPLLPTDRAARLLATVEATLFTPYGLRERPGALTVTTDALGPFFSAWLRVHQRSVEAEASVRGWLETFHEAVAVHAVVEGHVPAGFEIEPGAGATEGRAIAPLPGGSVLSAAELLRAWIEELDPVALAPSDATPLTTER